MKTNSWLTTVLAITAGFSLLAPQLGAQDDKRIAIKSTPGPATARLGGQAEIQVPIGYEFTEGAALIAAMKAAGAPVSPDLLGAIEPTNAHWSVMFTFMEVGYLKDANKEKLDADKLLQDIRDGTEAANQQRASSGIPPIHVVGWEQPPKYNELTHNLEWAVKGESQGEIFLNYDTRLLGRKGVMKVKLIVDPKDFEATFPVFTNLMSGFKFSTGESYAEYRPGDKVAKYGLAALVAGGAAVGAAKLGLLGPVILFFKKAWKLVVVAIVACLGFFKKFFSHITGKKDE